MSALFQNKTLRKLPPVTRKFAKDLIELERIVQRGKKLVWSLQDIEKQAGLIKQARANDSGMITLRPMGFRDIGQKVEEIFPGCK